MGFPSIIKISVDIDQSTRQSCSHYWSIYLKGNPCSTKWGVLVKSSKSALTPHPAPYPPTRLTPHPTLQDPNPQSLLLVNFIPLFRQKMYKYAFFGLKMTPLLNFSDLVKQGCPDSKEKKMKSGKVKFRLRVGNSNIAFFQNSFPPDSASTTLTSYYVAIIFCLSEQILKISSI